MRHVPSASFFRLRTSRPVRMSAPRAAMPSNSCRVSEPKSTSVPASTRVAANGSSAFSRLSMSSGAHWLMTRESSLNWIVENSGCCFSDSYR